MNVKQLLIYLTIAFVIITIWNSPDSTGHNVGNFLGALGNWLADVADKTTTFLKNLKG